MVRVATGQPYGEAKRQADAQRVLPVEAPALPVAATPDAPLPGSLGWSAPTARPDEPVTAGLPVGPGPGPEALDVLSAASDMESQLRALYKQAPSEDLRRMIEEYEA